jgi:hypothetical protein
LIYIYDENRDWIKKSKKTVDKINNIAYNITYALGINDILTLGK